MTAVTKVRQRALTLSRNVMAAVSGLLMLVLLSSCASQPSSEPLNDPRADRTPAERPADNNREQSTDQTDPSMEAAMFLGSDTAVAMPESRPPISLLGDDVMLNFEQAPLNEVIHTILGDTLNLDYVIENQVPGTITLRTRSPVPRAELLPILESLLRNNDVLMVRGPNDRFFISGSPNIRSTIPRYSSAPATGFTNVIVPLQYISAAEMVEILQPVAREDAFVRVDAQRNLLILAGTQLQLEGWMDIISIFDVDQLAGMSVGIFPLTNSTIDDVFEEIQQILSGTAGEEGAAGISAMVNVQPIERLNSIMAVSPRAQYIEQIKVWVEDLDNIVDVGSEPTLHFYPVRNADASQLAQLMGSIYGGGGGGSQGSKGGVAPGMRQATSGSGAGTSGQQRNSGASVGASSFSFGDDVRVVADSVNNTLLVYATRYEYEKIEKILFQLDVVATQVLIEASIIEVRLEDGLEYGLEWTFDNNLGGGDTGTGLFDLGGGLGAKAGFSYTITNSADAVKAVLNTLAQRRLLNVISTPSVMVLDNHTASIHVGDQQPIQSSSTVTNGGNVQNSITYKDTGVKLQVTPTVNDGGLVTLDIDQSVTDVGPEDAATGQRSFLERKVASRVAIRDGESVVLGGLIRDNETEGKSGVPFLMDIPGLGALFSTTTESSTRTELLIFITPRVMESQQDMRDLNREMRARMKGLTDFEDLPVKFDP